MRNTFIFLFLVACGGSDPPASVCHDECAQLGMTDCSDGQLRVCESDGCLKWSAPTACASATCSDAATCAATSGCTDQCPYVGAGSCSAGQLRICRSSGSGCLDWGTPATCTSGQCATSQSCAAPSGGSSTSGSTSGSSASGGSTSGGSTGNNLCAGVSDPCTTPGSECSDGKSRTCASDYNGCLSYTPWFSCYSGFCSDASHCGVCNNQCFMGDTSCMNGQLRSCVSDANGCRDWGPASACASGFCGSTTSCGSCNNSCDTAGATDCSGGSLRTCQADAHGCLAWSSASACAMGFCSSKTSCGSCSTSLPLWKSGSCAEVVQKESESIGHLTASSDGLFWNRNGYASDSSLIQRSSSTTTVLGTLASLDINVINSAGAIYAHAGNSSTGTLFIKPAGSPLKKVDAWTTNRFVFATPDHAWFDGGASIYTPLRAISWATIPASCTPGDWCWLGSQSSFYSGTQEWPGSGTVAASDTTFFFISQTYGNYPANDIKRTSSKLFSMPIGGGTATELKTFYDEYGPPQLVFAAGKLYYPFKNTIMQLDPATNNETQLLYASTTPYAIATDGTDVFYIDSAQNLMRVNNGAELIASKVDYGYPYNLTVDAGYVYFTGDNRLTILRWKR